MPQGSSDSHPFAGEEIGRAVFYPEDERFFVERDLHADHYEVVFAELESARPDL